jgi:predicted DNA repair protein MutK
MPGASLIALLDDIASVLDDVAVLTKVATKKTAGVLGDDLALNAQQVSGIRADRELPVVWAVAKGSLVNKAILVPSALAISAVAPWLVTPLLMVGGGFLCFEGCEKLAHKLFHGKEELEADKQRHLSAVANPEVDLVAVEKEKVKGAVRTDFVLSAEIVAIALGTVAAAPFMTRVWVLVGLAVLMTAGVYGLVAGIVKLDDAGAWLVRRADATNGAAAALQRGLGSGILHAAPWLMKGLSVAGTIAMFLVGGGILSHGIPGAHDVIHHAAESVAALPAVGSVLATLLPTLADLLVGLVAGSLILAVVLLVKRLRGRTNAPA